MDLIRAFVIGFGASCGIVGFIRTFFLQNQINEMRGVLKNFAEIVSAGLKKE